MKQENALKILAEHEIDKENASNATRIQIKFFTLKRLNVLKYAQRDTSFNMDNVKSNVLSTAT